MQNKTLFQAIFVMSFMAVPAALAEEAAAVPQEPAQDVQAASDEKALPALDVLDDFSGMDLSQKKPVDFTPRTSLDTLELTPLPGIFETNIPGPQTMGAATVNDAPSEQLLGRLTPDVFQEMADLERDNAFLKLQLQKEQMKIDLENLKSQYRQNRLDEIAKREEVVRSRIQWWQEQEKVRQAADNARLESEELKNQRAQAEALREQLAAAQANQNVDNADQALVEKGQDAPIVAHDQYVLLNVKGTRGNLVAKVKNTTTNAVSKVRIGDDLSGEVVTGITPENVIIMRDNAEFLITFAPED